MKGVLNVGGGSRRIGIPSHYDGWDHVLLDIDDSREPDLVWDARELDKLAKGAYDAVYCSHNLEHYWRHEVPRVLKGFEHVLAPDGFAEVAVPDLKAVFERVLGEDMELDDVLYESPSGPITANDVVYGLGRAIEGGYESYAHKTAFTVRSLTKALTEAGFRRVYTGKRAFELRAFAFTSDPTPEQQALLKLPSHVTMT